MCPQSQTWTPCSEERLLSSRGFAARRGFIQRHLNTIYLETRKAPYRGQCVVCVTLVSISCRLLLNRDIISISDHCYDSLLLDTHTNCYRCCFLANVCALTLFMRCECYTALLCQFHVCNIMQYGHRPFSQRTSTKQSPRDTRPLALMTRNGDDIVVVHGRSPRGSTIEHGFSE